MAHITIFAWFTPSLMHSHMVTSYLSCEGPIALHGLMHFLNGTGPSLTKVVYAYFDRISYIDRDTSAVHTVYAVYTDLYKSIQTCTNPYSLYIISCSWFHLLLHPAECLDPLGPRACARAPSNNHRSGFLDTWLQSTRMLSNHAGKKKGTKPNYGLPKNGENMGKNINSLVQKQAEMLLPKQHQLGGIPRHPKLRSEFENALGSTFHGPGTSLQRRFAKLPRCHRVLILES